MKKWEINMSTVEFVENPTVSNIDETLKLKQVVSQDLIDRVSLIQQLSDLLTIHEAASLVVKIHEKTTTVSKGKRFGLYPINDWNAFERTKRLEASFWQADEVEFNEAFSPDNHQWLLAKDNLKKGREDRLKSIKILGR